jgi:hypothetical protein
MSWLMLSIVVLACQLDTPAGDQAADAGSGSEKTVQASQPRSETPRRLTDIDRSIRDAMRAEATAQTDDERLAAVRQMAEAYREILEDPRFATSDTLKSYRARLWSRMTRVRQDAERRQAREKQQQAKDLEPGQLAAIEFATRSLADQMTSLNYTMGGPAYVFQQGGGAMGGGAVQDHAQELIELIQRTIKPDFWDTAGGPGSMFYYRPLMALVVSATSEMHGNVGGLLQALRRAGQ